MENQISIQIYSIFYLLIPYVYGTKNYLAFIGRDLKFQIELNTTGFTTRVCQILVYCATVCGHHLNSDQQQIENLQRPAHVLTNNCETTRGST